MVTAQCRCLFAFVSVVLLSLAAQQSARAQQTDAPPNTKVLHIPLQRSPSSLDPASFATTDAIWIATQLFQRLFTYTPTGSIAPELVQTWSASHGGRHYHLTLRTDAHFSDNSLVTAEDVAFTIQRLLRHSKRERHFLSHVEGAATFLAGKTTTLSGLTIHDQRSLTVRFTRPVLNFVETVASPSYFILPVKFAATIENGEFFKKPTGSGPYGIRTWTHDDLWLEPNTFYAGVRPWVASIHFQFLGGMASLGKADLHRYDLIPGIPSEADVQLPGFHTKRHLHMTSTFLTFNMLHPMWQQPSLRQSFARLFDTDAFYRVLFQGRDTSWLRSTSLLPYRTFADIEQPPKQAMRQPAAQTMLIQSLSDPSLRTIVFIACDHLPLARLQHAVDAATVKMGLSFVAKKTSLHDLATPHQQHGLLVTQLAMDTPDPYEILVYFSADAPSHFANYTVLTDEIRAVRSRSNRMDRMTNYQRLAERLTNEHIVIPIAATHSEQILVRNDLNYAFASPLGPWFSGLQHIQPQGRNAGRTP